MNVESDLLILPLRASEVPAEAVPYRTVEKARTPLAQPQNLRARVSRCPDPATASQWLVD